MRAATRHSPRRTRDGVWVADDEPLENEDVVLWYVFGIHHITRVEDWPIMPADIVSFWLKPFGFFDRNPSIDAPATTKHGDRRMPPGAGYGLAGSDKLDSEACPLFESGISDLARSALAAPNDSWVIVKGA